MRTNTVQGQKSLSVILDDIEQRANAATSGPWEHFGGSGTHAIRGFGHKWDRVVGCDIDKRDGDMLGGGVWDMKDAIFIATARTDVPALVKALRHACSIIDNAGIAIATLAEQEITAILNGEKQ